MDFNAADKTVKISLTAPTVLEALEKEEREKKLCVPQLLPFRLPLSPCCWAAVAAPCALRGTPSTDVGWWKVRRPLFAAVLWCRLRFSHSSPPPCSHARRPVRLQHLRLM